MYLGTDFNCTFTMCEYHVLGCLNVSGRVSFTGNLIPPTLQSHKPRQLVHLMDLVQPVKLVQLIRGSHPLDGGRTVGDMDNLDRWCPFASRSCGWLWLGVVGCGWPWVGP